jgi:hypothetical protein
MIALLFYLFALHFQCYFLDENEIFISHIIYPEISLACNLVPNSTVGEWSWSDEGKVSKTLPDCQVHN